MSAILDGALHSLRDTQRLADIAANEAAMLLRPCEPMESATEYAQRRARENDQQAARLQMIDLDAMRCEGAL